MAEAAVEENVIEPSNVKFFCHKCGVEISRVLDDFTCPTCGSGFIEELVASTPAAADDGDDSTDDDDDMGELDVGDFNPVALLTQVNEVLFGLGAERNDRGSRGQNLRNLTGTHFVDAGAGRRTRRRGYRNLPAYEPFEHVIQDFIVNLTEFGWGPAGHGHARTAGPVRLFLGNPGDYAWGREGLDAIVTQLLNQMDVAGPPPLPKDKIKEIPTSVITQEQADVKLQCSVCWDDFEAGECVRKLQCEHFYHEHCIIPWLELHGTCPICRKSLSGDAEDGNLEEHTHLPDLATILRGATTRWSSASPSTSATSTTSSTSTSTSTNNSSTRNVRPRPSSDSEMEFE